MAASRSSSSPPAAVLRDADIPANLIVIALPPALLEQFLPALSDGANAAISSIFNTASLAGCGIVIAVLRRVTAIPRLLPHNGAVATLLSICGVTHRRAYFDIFMAGLLIALVASIPIASI